MCSCEREKGGGRRVEGRRVEGRRVEERRVEGRRVEGRRCAAVLLVNVVDH